ncbi:helix-turn-helix transcriptional regulator [Pseudomonas lactis]|nr:helix-turn-helix transcriptional regulator [Pseudomonas lactis]
MGGHGGCSCDAKMISVCVDDFVIYRSHSQGIFVTDRSPFLRLKEERKRLKLTQAAAGAVAGVTRETWSRYEAGAVAPGMEALEAFALAGADVQYVLTGLRGSLPPSTRERLFLDQFRRSPEERQDEALRVLLGAQAPTSAQHTFQSVGQYIHGSVNQSGLTLNVGGKGKK